MTKYKNKKSILIYIIAFAIIALIFETINIKADETNEEANVVEKPKISEKVYEVEIAKNPNFEELKMEILENDIKYVAHPNKLVQDVSLSEVVASEIDYASYDVQQLELEVQRFADSKTEKSKIDTVNGIVNFKFVDTTAPEITITKDSVTIIEGDAFDAKEFLTEVSDNGFNKVEVEIEDNVDNEEVGKYEVVYTATDASKNTTSETLTVIVKEDPEVKAAKEAKKAEEARKVQAAKAATLQQTQPAQPSQQSQPVQQVAPTPAASNSVGGALSIINGHRANAGLAPLSIGGPQEQTAAAIRAAEASSYVSHVRPDGRHYRTAFSDQGVSHSNPLEILTYSGSNAAGKVAWWMSSSAHRAILLSPSSTHIALGVSGSMWAGIVY